MPKLDLHRHAARLRHGELVAGDPEYKVVEMDIKMQWLRPR